MLPFHENSYQSRKCSMKCPIYEMYYLLNVPFLKYPINEMSHL